MKINKHLGKSILLLVNSFLMCILLILSYETGWRPLGMFVFIVFSVLLSLCAVYVMLFVIHIAKNDIGGNR